MCNNTIHLLESFIEIGSSVSQQNYTFYRTLIFIVNYCIKRIYLRAFFFFSHLIYYNCFKCLFIYLIDLFKRLEREYYAIFIYFDIYHAIFITNFFSF